MSITNAWGFGLWLLGAMAVGCLAAGPAWDRLGGRQARKEARRMCGTCRRYGGGREAGRM